MSAHSSDQGCRRERTPIAHRPSPIADRRKAASSALSPSVYQHTWGLFPWLVVALLAGFPLPPASPQAPARLPARGCRSSENPPVCGEIPSGEKRKRGRGTAESGVRPEARGQGDSSRTRPRVGPVTVPSRPVPSLCRAAPAWAAARAAGQGHRSSERQGPGQPGGPCRALPSARSSGQMLASPFPLPCTAMMKNGCFP